MLENKTSDDYLNKLFPEVLNGRKFPTYVYFEKKLPFRPTTDQILYVEDKPYPEIHRFLEDHLAEIQQGTQRNGYEFYSLATAQTVTTPTEVLNYIFPFQHFDAPVQTKSYVTQDLLPFLTRGKIDGPMLIHYRKYRDARALKHPEFYYCFTCTSWNFDLEGNAEKQFAEATRNFSKDPLWKKPQNVFCSIAPGADVADADAWFSPEANRLKDEIVERMQQLRRLGVNESQLHSLLTVPPKLSSLVITDDFRIILPDYNNREIKMTPLVKAVFVLFLRHPQGIMFKNLPEYRNELLFLYQQLTPRMNLYQIKQSVVDVTDPTNNSINEKCARIREAFVSQFDPIFAEHYCVTGQRGAPKRIQLNRSLVKLPDVLKKKVPASLVKRVPH